MHISSRHKWDIRNAFLYIHVYVDSKKLKNQLSFMMIWNRKCSYLRSFQKQILGLLLKFIVKKKKKRLIFCESNWFLISKYFENVQLLIPALSFSYYWNITVIKYFSNEKHLSVYCCIDLYRSYGEPYFLRFQYWGKNRQTV